MTKLFLDNEPFILIETEIINFEELKAGNINLMYDIIEIHNTENDEIESKLNVLMEKVLKGQMERNEYEYVSQFLGNKNFLVFGTGYDTEFWRHCNKGINIFLEHDKNWIPQDSRGVYLVNYKTQILKYKEYLNDYTSLEMDLPQQVLDTTWDVIFVDGPPGNKKRSFGRMQSIYTAYKLANKDTDVFVHDCDRPVEDTYTKHFFEIKKELKKLRHCKRK